MAVMCRKSAILLAMTCALCAASGSAIGEKGSATRPASLQQGLKLTEKEVTALGAVEDRISQWQETAFYMLLKRVAGLAELTEQDLRTLDRPAYQNLLGKPDRYRLHPMRLNVRVFRVLKMTPETGLGFSRYWPKGREVWRMYCTSAGIANYADEPLTVYCTVEPSGLGQPARTTTEGEMQFPRGPEVEIAAVLYKIYKATESGGEQWREYPLLLAWQIRDGSDGERTPGFTIPSGPLAAFLCIAALALAYYFVRRTVRQMRKAAPAAQYRPIRDEKGESLPPAEDDQEDRVDPLLQQAAEQYEKERRQADGTDRQD